MKTSELIGPALDWAVAKCEGIDNFDCMGIAYVVDPDQPHFNNKFSPSTKWSQGGPIIERESGTLWNTNSGGWRCKAKYDYTNDKEGVTMHGPTPLIAAMRCYVASKLGDDVEIPDELTA